MGCHSSKDRVSLPEALPASTAGAEGCNSGEGAERRGKGPAAAASAAVPSPASASTVASSGGVGPLLFPPLELGPRGAPHMAEELPTLLGSFRRGGAADAGAAPASKASVRARLRGLLRPGKAQTRIPGRRGGMAMAVAAPGAAEDRVAKAPQEVAGTMCQGDWETSSIQTAESQRRLVEKQFWDQPEEAPTLLSTGLHIAYDSLAVVATQICGGCGHVRQQHHQPSGKVHTARGSGVTAPQDMTSNIKGPQKTAPAGRDSFTNASAPHIVLAKRRRRTTPTIEIQPTSNQRQQRENLRRVFLQTSSRGRRLLAAGRSALF